jgi:hypothetical protein
MAPPDVLLSDVLTQRTTVQIFHSLLRQVDSVYERLCDEQQHTVVLAPQDQAMVELARKPWETLDDVAEFGVQAYEGVAGKERADRNIERFVKEHVLDAGDLTHDAKVKDLNGETVWAELGNAFHQQIVCPSLVCPAMI